MTKTCALSADNVPHLSRGPTGIRRQENKDGHRDNVRDGGEKTRRSTRVSVGSRWALHSCRIKDPCSLCVCIYIRGHACMRGASRCDTNVHARSCVDVNVSLIPVRAEEMLVPRQPCLSVSHSHFSAERGLRARNKEGGIPRA